MRLMLLEYVDKLDAQSLLSPELFDELFEIENEFDRELQRQKLEERALSFNIKTRFNKSYNAKYKEYKKSLKTVKNATQGNNITNFSSLGGADKQLYCGDWIADDSGVRIHTEKGMADASYHPIYPVRILRNSETGQYKVELEFVIRGKVRRALVDRDVIASNNKILKLANDSVQVTTVNASFLVKYLADVEALNPDIITEYSSTSRLGWIDDIDANGDKVKKFLPYEKEVVFDNELNTKALFDSITCCGYRTKWYELLKEIRSKRQTEFLVNLAASFASVLVEPCGALPFIVSLWGGTGIGKTVVLMLTTSVWADPSEGAYMTDAKATSTAMEIRLNILNSLPMTLDDMAQVKNQYDEDFSQLIYRWCAGKGRDRSNTNLGLNKLTSWRNCTITNGERSLVDESTQGGAVNRVIDIEAEQPLFDGEYGNYVANTVRANYGYAGEDFIKVITQDGYIDEINKTVNEYFKKIKDCAKAQGVEKEDKQIMPMALILTADEIIEKELFKDGVRLDLEKCVSYLKNKGEVSEHKRAYEYIQDVIVSQHFHFLTSEETYPSSNIEVWGCNLPNNRVLIIGSIFDRIMKEGSFQSRAFLSWAAKQKIIEVDASGNKKVQKKIAGNNRRCVVLRLEEDAENADFTRVSDIDELPFE